MASDPKLVVALEARVRDFERSLARAQKSANDNFGKIERDGKRMSSTLERGIGGAATRVGGILKNFGAGLVGGIFAGGAAGVLSQVTSIAKGFATVGDEAKRAGLSSKAFQELSFVASQSRIGVDSLVDGIKELNLRADEWILTGAGPAAEAFTRLGYSAEELKEKLKDPSALFTEIIGKLENLDKAAQIRIADEVFGGTGGEKFVQLISQGEQGIRDTIQAANDLGLVLDEDLIQKADELDRKFEAVATTVGTGLKRAIVEAAGALDDFITRFRQFDADYRARTNAAEMGAMVGSMAGGTPVRTTPKGDRLGQQVNVPFNPLPAVDLNRAVQLAAARERIAALESAGSGGYKAIGPVTESGDRAFGKYQVMGANIADWTKKTIGTTLTSDQFLNNPKVQDAVFDKIFGGYIDRFGMEGAAQAWFGGPGAVGKTGRQDLLGTTVGAYGEKFMGGGDVQTVTDAWTGLRDVTDATAASTAAVAAEYDAFGTIATTALGGIANALADSKIEAHEWLQILAQVAQQLLTMPVPQGGTAGGGFLSTVLGSLLGAVPGFAEGGRVRGPGGPTGDKIPAMLSSGEHVTRAAMARKYGPLLDAINADRVPRLADGGFVNPPTIPVPQVPARLTGGAAKEQPVAINVNVEGASGDAHIVDLVRKGVSQGIVQYDRELNGSFGKRMNMAQRRQI